MSFATESARARSALSRVRHILPRCPGRRSAPTLSHCSGRRAACICTDGRSRHGCHYRRLMNRHTLVLICTLALATRVQIEAIDVNRPRHEHPPSHGYGVAGEQDSAQKYTCPMHPEVITDHPRNCPKCGMKLVPLEQKKRQTSNSDESRAGVQRLTSNQ